MGIVESLDEGIRFSVRGKYQKSPVFELSVPAQLFLQYVSGRVFSSYEDMVRKSGIPENMALSAIRELQSGMFISNGEAFSFQETPVLTPVGGEIIRHSDSYFFS